MYKQTQMVEIYCRVKKVTEKAILVVNYDNEEKWIPISQTNFHSVATASGNKISMKISEWIASEKEILREKTEEEREEEMESGDCIQISPRPKVAWTRKHEW